MAGSTILVTGTAGFIGYHTAERLIAAGHRVVGIDIVNDYYDPSLKEARLKRLHRHGEQFIEERINLADASALFAAFDRHRPQKVINLAAQAGVRYSLENPRAYADSNLTGFFNMLEACRLHDVGHLVYASTSSVYGANTTMPFSEHQGLSHQKSLYAATKRANELLAHSYSHMFGLPTTGLRFFTVYGPWGRPDMALFMFTKAILAGEPINVYNHGDMKRDFTYIDDIVEGIVRVTDRTPAPDPEWDAAGDNPDPGRSGIAPYRVFNIGNGAPVQLMDFITAIEDKLGRKAEKKMMDMQIGDVPATFADTTALDAAIGYKPATPIDVGIDRFIDWYRGYYGV
ncbi:NAD-dependent epimerase [Fodinicurvata sp. EGI_FJ10296]|uniref:NAD-dependent epimerase n=1 Tax=Fodinicurvata sp. EGI_FJ10296 TaxID=3231908 RepID=UPI00345121AA